MSLMTQTKSRRIPREHFDTYQHARHIVGIRAEILEAPASLSAIRSMARESTPYNLEYIDDFTRPEAVRF